MRKKRMSKRCILSILATGILVANMGTYGIKAKPFKEALNATENGALDNGALVDETSGKLKLSSNRASMTEKRTLEASFELPKGAQIEHIKWTYGGKPLSQWKKN